jgi:hypothetical protein
MQHDGKCVRCIGCNQPFKIAFSIPAAQRRLAPAMQITVPPLVYRPASAPVNRPFPQVQANTQPVIIASFFALVVAVVVIGFAMAGSSGADKPQQMLSRSEFGTQFAEE